MRLKQGDLAPLLRIDTNADLTGTTSRLAKIRRIGTTTTMSKTLTTVGAATDGIAEYQWVAPDTDVAGTYQIEALITFADARVQRFPQHGYMELIIDPKVG
jgi:hypothetical protein